MCYYTSSQLATKHLQRAQLHTRKKKAHLSARVIFNLVKETKMVSVLQISSQYKYHGF